ncbi:MAG TPA: hypothetical protein DEQ32_05620, partial [Gammaproteobacteria bacterium]|nr:hypothetical protein [Gammaproteobacteria bacterium]
TFFGLNDAYIESVYEEAFQLKYYGGWSFFEVYNLPIRIRRWFLTRLIKQKHEEAEAINKQVGQTSTPQTNRGRTYNLK